MEKLRIHDSWTYEQQKDPAGIDLLHGPIRLVRGTFQPASPAEKGGNLTGPYGGGPLFDYFEPVIEVFDVMGEGSAEVLIAAEDAIHGYLERARLWHQDPSRVDSIWLEWTAEGEEVDDEPTLSYPYGAKRALIYRGSLVQTMPEDSRGAFLDGVYYGRLTIERGPFWENIVAKEATNWDIGSHGYKEDITAMQDNRGSVPGRLALFGPYAISFEATDLWAGIRSEGFVGFNTFDPVWELEDGTNGTDATDSADATASDGNKVVVSFATEAGLDERLTIDLGQAHPAGNTQQFMGRYLVLCRCKVGSSTVCGIRLSYGFQDTPYGAQEETFIDHTVWQLVELGEIQIPPSRVSVLFYDHLNDLEQFTISIEAERISGSGSLDLDCLIMIPAEHLAVFRDISDGSYVPIVRLYTLENQAQFLLMAETGIDEWRSSGTVATRDWVIPTDAGLLITAYQKANTTHDMTDTAAATITWFPRWKRYRARA